MDIKDVIIAPQSPLQTPFVEQAALLVVAGICNIDANSKCVGPVQLFPKGC